LFPWQINKFPISENQGEKNIFFTKKPSKKNKFPFPKNQVKKRKFISSIKREPKKYFFLFFIFTPLKIKIYPCITMDGKKLFFAKKSLIKKNFTCAKNFKKNKK